MSKALIGLAAVAALGGLAFYARKSDAAESDMQMVTGASGTTYGVKLAHVETTPQGIEQTFEVYDASGLILGYAQFQGDNAHRILIPTPAAVHPVGDAMWQQALTDFGITASAA